MKKHSLLGLFLPLFAMAQAGSLAHAAPPSANTDIRVPVDNGGTSIPKVIELQTLFAGQQNVSQSQTLSLILGSSRRLRKVSEEFASLFPENTRTPEIRALISAIEKTLGAADEAGQAFERISTDKKVVTLGDLNANLRAVGALRANLKELSAAIKKVPRGAGVSAQQNQLLGSALDTLGELTQFLETLGPVLQTTRDQVVNAK